MAQEIPTPEPFGPEELKAQSREDFTGNECDTDEYRETEPMKGLSYVADVLEEMHGDAWLNLVRLTAKWLTVLGDEEARKEKWSYAGAEELQPILEIVHDWYWERGKHPYYEKLADLEEWNKETEEK